jgi:photosystem II stability/assembly factor-like uncharacterized protein
MKRVFAFVAIVTLAVGVCPSCATSRWAKYKSSPTEADINAVTLLDANSGWAVGYGGKILRFRDGKWSVFFTWPTQSLHDVAFGGPNFGVAVGHRGTGCVFNGERWKVANISSSCDFYGAAVPPGQNSVAWAVGANGNVWRWTGGANGYWSRWNLGTNYNLRDIHFTGATEGWLCGDGGRVYYFKGEWTPVNVPTAVNFYCIYGLSATDAWVGGTDGTIYHYGGVSWARVQTPTSEAIRELYFPRATAGWAACDGGTILRYKDGRWSRENTNPATSENFYGICMASVRKGWAVGTGGTIYEYRGFPGVSPTSFGRVKALFK